MSEIEKPIPEEFGSDELAPYLSYIEKSEKIDGPLAPIGVILYDNKKKLAIVASDLRGDLKCAYAQEGEFKPEDVDISSTRILELSRYKTVQVTHLNFGGIKIGTSDSLRQSDSMVYAQITMIDPKTQQEKILDLDETELLNFMIGKAGGIAPFYGPGLTDEYALVFEKTIHTDLTATIAFAHPENVGFKLRSIEGYQTFIESLNKQFLKKKGVDPKVKDIIDHIDEAQAKGKTNESVARTETLKAQLIAYSRLASLKNNQADEYKDLEQQLLKQLPFSRSRISDLFGASNPDSFTTAVENSINNLMLTDDDGAAKLLQPAKVQEATDSQKSIILKTATAKKLYDYYHNYLGDNYGKEVDTFTKKAMDAYLVQIMQLLTNRSKTSNGYLVGIVEDWEDLDSLLKELSKTGYGKNATIKANIFYTSDYYDPDKFSRGDDNISVANQINRLVEYIADKRTQALTERFELNKATNLKI